MTWEERTFVPLPRVKELAALWHELGERVFDAIMEGRRP